MNLQHVAGNASGCDVLCQAALTEELEPMLDCLSEPAEQQTGPWTFWAGTIADSTVVICRTDEGPINAAAATALGIHLFRPRILLNQGIAGAHNPELRKGDIVLARDAVDYSGFRSLAAARGEGIQCGRWSPKPHKIRTAPDTVTKYSSFPADSALLKLAGHVPYEHGRVFIGTVGSALQFNLEVDRILWLRETYGTDSEDQESAYAAGVATAMQVPFLGIRVISDSVFADPVLDKSLGRLSAEFCLSLIRLLGKASAA